MEGETAETALKDEQLLGWQYKTLATWFERVGLLLFGSLVVQQIVAGFAVNIPLIVLGLVASTVTYYTAYYYLKKATH